MDRNPILLVEDDSNDVLLLERAFQKAGMRHLLTIVSDGEEAIDYLLGNGDYADREKYPLPFLVLLDLKMPRSNGFEVLRRVRSEPKLKRLLIVVLTSSNLQADVDRSYELGANSYLVKPVEFDEMVHLIKRFEAYWSEINRTPSATGAAKNLQAETILG